MNKKEAVGADFSHAPGVPQRREEKRDEDALQEKQEAKLMAAVDEFVADLIADMRIEQFEKACLKLRGLHGDPLRAKIEELAYSRNMVLALRRSCITVDLLIRQMWRYCERQDLYRSKPKRAPGGGRKKGGAK